MNAGTKITVKVNSVIVSGEPLSQWFILNNILPAGGTTTDQTVDAWINNVPQTRVELATKADGTPRAAGTEFEINDNGKVGIGTTNSTISSKNSKVLLLNNGDNNGIASLKNVPVSAYPYGNDNAIMGMNTGSVWGGGIAGYLTGSDEGPAIVGRSFKNPDYTSGIGTRIEGYVGGMFYGGDVGVFARGGYFGGFAGNRTNKYGIFAEVFSTNPGDQLWAGYFKGRVAIFDGTEGIGKVLTSDASGNASWQDQTSQSVGISMQLFTSNITVPHATYVPIVNWLIVKNEDGGSNYNPATGEYTISVPGVYQINATALWINNGSGTGSAGLSLYINGSFEMDVSTPVSASAWITNVISYARRLNVGDKVSFKLVQYSGAPMTLNFNSGGQTFSVQYLHK
ncbi:MAG: hypothetical protein A2X64_10125 [Ignavibacteria bacterium GWF2_33_9]|nr:MAG: hypothetical protein A2X64_10125 [Ignavibacteria bacterium GWF2_33_9]